jgi:hypothetical protein
MTEHDPEHLPSGRVGPPGSEEHRVRTGDDAVVLLMWITLSRVAEGGVIQRGGNYRDGDAPLPPYLAASVPTLLTEGLLAVADPDPAGWHQLILTEAGQSRHEQLGRCGQRGSALQPEGTSLPVRVPGAHLHPLLCRPPSWAGPSTRAGGQV